MVRLFYVIVKEKCIQYGRSCCKQRWSGLRNSWTVGLKEVHWRLQMYINHDLLVIACVYITIVGSIGSISCKMWSMCLLSAGRFMHVISLLNAFESRIRISVCHMLRRVLCTHKCNWFALPASMNKVSYGPQLRPSPGTQSITWTKLGILKILTGTGTVPRPAGA